LGGTFYGGLADGGKVPCTSYIGGGCGVLFSFNPHTGVEKTLHTFTGVKDGWGPQRDIVAYHGKLYGITSGGGNYDCHASSGCGVLYEYDLATHTERVVYAFRAPDNSFDTADPTISLVDDTIYGTVGPIVNAHNGAIFSYKP